MEKIPFTRAGLERIREELKRLTNVERPANIRAIEEARAHGDLSENAEYHAAKEKQAFIGAKIQELTDVLSRAEVVENEDGPKDRVVFGCKVLLYNVQNEEEVWYEIVGPYESEPENGRISIHSPLAQGLLGKEVDDLVRIKTPKGLAEYEILEIR